MSKASPQYGSTTCCVQMANPTGNERRRSYASSLARKRNSFKSCRRCRRPYLPRLCEGNLWNHRQVDRIQRRQPAFKDNHREAQRQRRARTLRQQQALLNQRRHRFSRTTLFIPSDFWCASARHLALIKCLAQHFKGTFRQASRDHFIVYIEFDAPNAFTGLQKFAHEIHLISAHFQKKSAKVFQALARQGNATVQLIPPASIGIAQRTT